MLFKLNLCWVLLVPMNVAGAFGTCGDSGHPKQVLDEAALERLRIRIQQAKEEIKHWNFSTVVGDGIKYNTARQPKSVVPIGPTSKERTTRSQIQVAGSGSLGAARAQDNNGPCKINDAALVKSRAQVQEAKAEIQQWDFSTVVKNGITYHQATQPKFLPYQPQNASLPQPQLQDAPAVKAKREPAGSHTDGTYTIDWQASYGTCSTNSQLVDTCATSALSMCFENPEFHDNPITRYFELEQTGSGAARVTITTDAYVGYHQYHLSDEVVQRAFIYTEALFYAHYQNARDGFFQHIVYDLHYGRHYIGYATFNVRIP